MIGLHLFSRRVLASPPRLGTSRRWLSRALEANLTRPVQSYISASRDPVLNLSIEHHLLQKADPQSVVLFLYVNRPSIIIGRNQNPWLEVNLALLNSSHANANTTDKDNAQSPPSTNAPPLPAVELIRRRSGGGTVFHDSGNVNWTVISPSSTFTRDKHAEMVVRGLRANNIARARVNERHDIVLDQANEAANSSADPQDTHITPYTSEAKRPVKVSGSAYKLTRARALHHATCLLSSPNLGVIPEYLRSPAKGFITARGVESVSSPVGNVGLAKGDFERAVQREFAAMYGDSNVVEPVVVGEEWLDDANVRKGYEELETLDWTFCQTPQFSLSTPSTADFALHMELHARYGSITAGSLKLSDENEISLDETLGGLKVHEISSWRGVLGPTIEGTSAGQSEQLIEWLQRMLPAVR